MNEENEIFKDAFEKVWSELEPDLEKNVIYALRSNIEREFSSVVKKTVEGRVKEITRKFLDEHKEEIEERVKKQLNLALDKTLEKFEDIFTKEISTSLETIYAQTLNKLQNNIYSIISKLRNE